MQKMRVESLGWEDPLEKWKANYSSRLAWRIPCVHGVANSRTWLSDFHSLHTVKVFSIVSEAEVDVFLAFPCFFYDRTDAGNLVSDSSAFSKSSLYIWKFLAHVLLKPSLKNFEHYLASMWDECNCTVVWAFFDIVLLWDWDENWPFPVLWPLLSFPNLLA